MKKLSKSSAGLNKALRSGRADEAGFTLIELVIVIAIVGILTTIAYASYENSIVKSRRKAATSCALEASQFMERFYTTNLRYNQTNATTPVAVAMPQLGCDTDLTGFYDIQFNGTPTAIAYSVEAAPQGVQATKDAKCGTLRINQLGQKTITGTVGTVDECWNK